MLNLGLIAAGKSAGSLVLMLSVALLLFILLRSLKQRRVGTSRHASCLKARVFDARQEIYQIDSSNWMQKHAAAIRISRHALELSPAERTSLRTISAAQAMAGGE